MSTTDQDQISGIAVFSAEQQQRAEAFAARERERHEELATAQPQAASAENVLAAAGGSATTSYSVTLSVNTAGYAVLNWNVQSSPWNQPVIAGNDWVGVFTNTGQALVNPNSNFLGGNSGWQWASKGGPYTTDVVLQNGYVAAYITKNSAGNYVAVAITAPYQG